MQGKFQNLPQDSGQEFNQMSLLEIQMDPLKGKNILTCMVVQSLVSLLDQKTPDLVTSHPLMTSMKMRMLSEEKELKSGLF